jgi:hypothetical protein
MASESPHMFALEILYYLVPAVSHDVDLRWWNNVSSQPIPVVVGNKTAGYHAI